MTTATAITMTAVESSQIAAIGHDAATNTLAIQFASKIGPGSVYHYRNFTADLFAAFAGAESIGSHFGKHIKPFGDKFPFVKIVAPTAPASRVARDALAALLNGREYDSEITKAEEVAAKVAGLLVIFGGSDDLMEFRGVDHDEIGAPTVALIDARGLLPYREDIEHDDDALKDYFARAPMVRAVDALWCGAGGWTYRTDVPHATFEIVEDGEPYCRGIVIDVADLAAP